MIKTSSLQAILAVFIGGGLGSIIRYLFGVFLNRTNPHIFPIHTLSANVVGCFVIGLVFAFFASRADLSSNLKLFLTVGFCGGFTTFSTFSYETINLLQTQSYQLAGLYVFLSGVLCFGAVILGISAGGTIGRNL